MHIVVVILIVIIIIMYESAICARVVYMKHFY